MSKPREHWPDGPSHRGISGVGRLDGALKTPAWEEIDCDPHAEAAPSADEIVVGGEEYAGPSYPMASCCEGGREADDVAGICVLAAFAD